MGGDPINATDPSGLACRDVGKVSNPYCDPANPDDDAPLTTVTAPRFANIGFPDPFRNFQFGGGGYAWQDELDRVRERQPVENPNRRRQSKRPQRSFADCAKQTAKTAGAGLALDVAGVGLAFAAPAKVAVALGRLAVGALAVTNSSVNGDAIGFTAGVTAYSFAAVGPESVRLSKAAKTSRGRAIAGAIPVVGAVVAIGTLAYDSYNAYQSYQQCRNGQ